MYILVLDEIVPGNGLLLSMRFYLDTMTPGSWLTYQHAADNYFNMYPDSYGGESWN